MDIKDAKVGLKPYPDPVGLKPYPDPVGLKPYPDPDPDPEADMVVWDALEVGEHFITEADFEAIKINKRQYVVLGGSKFHTMGAEPVYQIRKFHLA